MRILLAEDNNDKIAKVMELLTRVCGITDAEVSVAHTVLDAKRELRAALFDLLILDVRLPNRPGEVPSHVGTIDLLEELATRDTLQKPPHIVGLTAYDEAVAEAGPSFVKRTWTVIKFSFELDDWKDQLGACVTYIRTSSLRSATPEYKTDLCVVAALPIPELQAVGRLEWTWGSPEPLDDNTFVKRGSFQSGGATYSVVASSPTKIGMVSAALHAAKLIERERPRFLVMSGICAGVRGKANLGDIILGDPVWDWQSGKHLGGAAGHAFAIAPDPLSVASFVRARADQLRTDPSVWAEIRAAWPNPPAEELKLRIGPMATGSAVLADQDLVQAIVNQHRNLLAIEMEAYGVVAASTLACHPRPTAFALKSVCDFADDQKGDERQAYAAYTSASAVCIFFERYMQEIVGLAGTT